MLICFENFHFQNEKHYESLMLWQIDDLMLMLVNKLATVMLEASRQYSCCIKKTNSETKNLIWMLSLQMIIWSKIRLIADDFMSFRKVFKSFNQKTMFFDNFIREFTFFDNLNAREKKLSILNLIKNAQEFNLLCKWISS